MTITSARVRTIDYLHNACDLKSLTCMGNKRHLVRLDDNPVSDPGFFTQRYLLSTDDGQTWGEQPEHRATFLPVGPLLTTGFNTVLGGFGAGHAGDLHSPYALIARSTDGGTTWASSVTASFWSTLDPENSDIYTFVSLGGQPAEILAFGGVDPPGGLRYHVLRSTDGGVTFGIYSVVGLSPASPLSLVDVACYAGNDVVLVAGDFLGGSFPAVSLWRSVNRGFQWDEIALPSPGGVGSVATITSLGGGVVLAGGQAETFDDPNHVIAVVWRSVDYGFTWTRIDLPAFTFDPLDEDLQRYTVNWLLPLTTSKVVAGISIFGAPPTVKHWRLSTDGGVSFDDLGVETSPLAGGAGIVRQMTVADDGAVLTLLSKPGAPPRMGEIWRSTVDGFTGPGHCASAFQDTPPGELPGPCNTPFRSRLGDCDDTLTDADIIRGRWQAGDRLIINRVIFSVDWDHVIQQFTKHVVFTFNDSVRKYGLRPAMRIESKGIRSRPTACGPFGTLGCGLAMLEERAMNLGARFADPPPMLNLEVFYRKHTWEPGDIICVTSAFVPNTVAGIRGIDNEAFEIINIQQHFVPEGKVLLSLLDVEAITFPGPPSVIIAEDEQEMLARLREQQVYMTELPLRLGEVRAQRRITSLFGRGKTQEGVVAGGDIEFDPRGFFPGVP